MPRKIFRHLSIVEESPPQQSPGCEDCAATIHWTATVGQDSPCPKCGTFYLAPANDNAAILKTGEPEFDLDNLETFLGLIEGITPRLDSIYSVEGRQDSSGKHRKKPLSLDEDGEAITAKNKGGHPVVVREYALERFYEAISRAVQTLRKLETLMETPAGTRHALVLMAAYLMCGPELRAMWKARATFETWIGYVFSSVEDRAFWFDMRNANGSYRTETGQDAARQFGKLLLDAARHAYRSLPPSASRPVHGRPRLVLSEIRDVLSRGIVAAWQDVHRIDALILQEQEAAGMKQAS